VLILDRQQHVTGLSRAAEAMLGLHAGTTRGRLLHEVCRQPELHRFVAAALKGGGPDSTEIVLDGEAPRRVRAAGSPLPDAEGRIVGLLIMLSDVTRLRRLEVVRSDFAANVSHELRTPITNIKGYVETLIETRLTDPNEGMRFLRIVARNAERLGAIVEDMLMLTQLERPEARDQLVREPARIAGVVEAMQLEQEAEARAKEIRIESAVPPDLIASVNPQLLQQAVGNLVNNAIKYGPRQSVVRVGASTRRLPGGRAELLIEVRDEGPGIPPEHLPRVFERFYRVDKARGREQGGTGLGLAIVKHIAQLHGGSVDVESEVGRGSVFRLQLPA
jgi:two-component system phosphate regulon sensor histidine kinase PhoR